ncbi:type I restriction enzyme HsdR N-terminal domain-containing protein [uncultured Muribaculum sp.]|uniref:type I restriction enzyme HsdR N-terminal domain-containing protein n=1 Tax=uncultured Muribaculum sp. TaxID=1918613 RepID=UPI0027120657|nr:type I restriction enzyme HsdR N-terminal domain-containing protein [uncultured Muribaculum sp.]
MELNLPSFDIRLQRDDEGVKIFDRLRKKCIILTPEEWVRQHFVNYLINHKGFPESLMANEIGITLNGTRRRCDTVVFDKHGSPMVIVEYKASSIVISQSTFDQIVRYNMVLHARYLIVSNGMNHYCCRIDYDNMSYDFLKEVPDYADLEPIRQ